MIVVFKNLSQIVVFRQKQYSLSKLFIFPFISFRKVRLQQLPKYSNMRERQISVSSNDDNFKVAPLIADDKLKQLKFKIISTLLGLSPIAHYQYHDSDDSTISKIKFFSILLYFLVPALIVIPASLIVQWKLHALAVLIPTIVNPILSLVTDCILKKQLSKHKYVITAIFSYLWCVHFIITRQLLFQSQIATQTYVSILILSLITLLTSSNTVIFSPVRQFSGSTFSYQQLSFHSTLYVRFFLVTPILLTELGLFYSSDAGIRFGGLVGLQYAASLTFIFWLIGWVSSLYNIAMYLVNNLMNCLVFGQQLTHSGNLFRDQSSWWIPILIFALNTIAIGLNVILIRIMAKNLQTLSKIVQNQHILLVCLSYFTSLLSSTIVYLSYRLSNYKKGLLKYGRQSLNSSKAIKCFFGHKQVIMVFLALAIPAAVCLLMVFVFGQYYNAYSGGRSYERQTNFIAQKIATYVLLGVDSICYIFFIIFKQITRVRSKIGWKLNLCFSDPKKQIQKNLFIRIVLKITGSLAIMGICLRIQNIEIISKFIMRIYPLSDSPHPYIQFFVTSILVPVLIYRSYKRSQNFSHFFHITIIISCVLTIVDSTTYLYQSIFVILAFPNFPENPLRLLFVSPFTIPKKLVHANQCLYQIGYIIINIITLFIYTATLGTLELTSIFGLPLYWCVLPTINCQQERQKADIRAKSQSASALVSDLQATNQKIRIDKDVSRSTPEHNLYQKIITQIPFQIFRNKQPGYYLIRISKYIILAEVVSDFYGLFEIVSFVGLETQQVTTCHAKQGEVLDRLIDYSWGQVEDNLKKCAFQQSVKLVIHQELCYKEAEFTTENEIKLTGVTESSQFYQLFKKCLIKSIIFYYNKMIKVNDRNELGEQNLKQGQILLQDIQGRLSVQKVNQIFPYSFITDNKKNFVFQAKFQDQNASKINGKKKLPPLKRQDKIKKEKIIDDFADLIDNSHTSSYIKQNADQKTQKLDIDKAEQDIQSKEVPTSGDLKKQASQIHMAIILSAYLGVIGKINYLNLDKVYRMLKKDKQAISQFQFQGGMQLVSQSLGAALKIAIGKTLESQDEINYQDFLNYEKNQFFGTLQSSGFSKAIEEDKADIWTALYVQSKRTLSIKRLAKNKFNLYMFSLENNAVQAVWNNLRFELLFATNDNDERYSIQTHEYLLRNLLVEACQQPYGYAGYYSQEFLNL